MDPQRRDLKAIEFESDLDLRTVRRFFVEPDRLAPKSRERIQAAIVEIGLSHLLAAPLRDPDAGGDLSQ